MALLQATLGKCNLYNLFQPPKGDGHEAPCIPHFALHTHGFVAQVMMEG